MIAKLPVQPKTGDREPVMDALYEMVDAAGGLEYSRETLCRIIVIAQEEFKKVRNPPYPQGGVMLIHQRYTTSSVTPLLGPELLMIVIRTNCAEPCSTTSLS